VGTVDLGSLDVDLDMPIVDTSRTSCVGPEGSPGTDGDVIGVQTIRNSRPVVEVEPGTRGSVVTVVVFSRVIPCSLSIAGVAVIQWLRNLATILLGWAHVSLNDGVVLAGGIGNKRNVTRS
jgi:hypothetical protein